MRKKIGFLFLVFAVVLALAISAPTQVAADGQNGTTLTADVTTEAHSTITYPWDHR